MSPSSFRLKIILPSGPPREVAGVRRIIVPTPSGMLEISPPQSNCIAAIVPGVAAWQAAARDCETVPVDHGLIIKAGGSVLLFLHGPVESAGDEPSAAEAPRPAFNTKTGALLVQMEKGFVESIVEFVPPARR